MKKISFFGIFVFLFLVFLPKAEAVYVSQCNTGEIDGPQNDCTHNNDSLILSEQCTTVYDSSVCSSMPSYLSAMASDCYAEQPSGVDCGMITQSGYYGREAYEFALYEANTVNMNDPQGTNGSAGNSATNGATNSTGTIGNLNFPDQFGLPNAPGGVRGVLASLLNWLLLIFGAIAMGAFIISGLQYFFSAGDEKLAGTAKRNMTYSILGVIAALSGFVIIRAIDAALRGFSAF